MKFPPPPKLDTVPSIPDYLTPPHAMSSTTPKPITENDIIGLKTNVKRGFSLADYWCSTYKKAEATIFKSWAHITDMEALEPLVWEVAGFYSHYKQVDSSLIGHYSTIKDMVIPAKTYTNKKGQTKTTPEERVPSHYSHYGGTYLGRVSDLGEEPISYPIELCISKRYFKFVGLGSTIEECFEALETEDKAYSHFLPQSKDVPKAQLKALRKATPKTEE